jgi:hypothetical protein
MAGRCSAEELKCDRTLQTPCESLKLHPLTTNKWDIQEIFPHPTVGDCVEEASERAALLLRVEPTQRDSSVPTAALDRYREEAARRASRTP